MRLSLWRLRWFIDDIIRVVPTAVETALSLGELMQRLLIKRLVKVVTIGAVLALSLPVAARADLDVAAACAPVGLADPVDRAAAAAALPTFSGVAQVCTVQALLATVGELPGSRTVDGRYDKQVRDALADFQRASGLDSTGLLNPETLAGLASAALDLIFAEPVSSATTVPATSESPTTLETDAAGDDAASVAGASEDFSETQLPAPRPTSIDDGAATAASGTVIDTTSAANTSAIESVAVSTDSSVVITGSRLSSSISDVGASPSSQAAAASGSTTNNTAAAASASADRVIVVDASGTDTDVSRVRVVVGGDVDANGGRIVSSEQTTVVTSTSFVETETYIVLADPLEDDSVSSFVRPSVCHDPTSVQDPDLIRNLDQLPDLVCLRVFEGAGDLPYQASYLLY